MCAACRTLGTAVTHIRPCLVSVPALRPFQPWTNLIPAAPWNSLIMASKYPGTLHCADSSAQVYINEKKFAWYDNRLNSKQPSDIAFTASRVSKGIALPHVITTIDRFLRSRKKAGRFLSARSVGNYAKRDVSTPSACATKGRPRHPVLRAVPNLNVTSSLKYRTIPVW